MRENGGTLSVLRLTHVFSVPGQTWNRDLAKDAPWVFGESIEVNPEPVQENQVSRHLGCNSEIKYDSEKHYRDDVFYAPIPTVTSFSETIISTPNCTWRNYKTQLHFEPRNKPLRFQSTTIIFPKHAKNIYRTTLSYNCGVAKKWFASSVQLEQCEENSPCMIYTENLSFTSASLH
ncbi:hypothetical protein FKM82_028590 [Ascaphus truei]